MKGRLAPSKGLLLPAILVTILISLLILLLNRSATSALNRAVVESATLAESDTLPNEEPPLQTPFYLPIVGAAGIAAGTIIPDEYIVVLKSEEVRAAHGEVRSSALYAADVVHQYGGEVLQTYDVALSGFAALLSQRALSELAADPNIAVIEPNRIVTVSGSQMPAPWGLDRIDQRHRAVDDAYNWRYTGAGVHVYILDSGLNAAHNDFAGRVGDGLNFVPDGRGVDDCFGHGTHVAGIIGGTRYGVAKEVTIHPMRVINCQGGGTDASVYAALDWIAEKGVPGSVINMSLASGLSPVFNQAVQTVIDQGFTVVVAAGNNNRTACDISPASAPQAITVGASTRNDARSSYSNYGTCVDLFAPGSNIISAWIDGTESAEAMNGTSMAAPHVAGAAALYIQAYPGASPAQVTTALLENATMGVINGPGAGSPNRLLYVAFLDSDPSPTNTPTHAPSSTPTVPTPTSTAVLPETPTLPPNTPAPPAEGELLDNGAFEAGRAVWEEDSALGYALICSSDSCGPLAVAAHSGTWKAWLGGANNSRAEIRQTITIPTQTETVLSFWYWTESTDWCGYDYAYVNLIVNGETIQVRRYSLCSTSNTNGWVRQSISLANYAGATVTLAVRASIDQSYTSSFFVDDLSVSTATVALGEAEAPDQLLFVEPPPPDGVKPAVPAASDVTGR